MRQLRTKEEMMQAKELAVILLRSGNSARFVSLYMGEHLGEIQRWQKDFEVFTPFPPHKVGETGEALALDLLTKRGLPAVRMPQGHPFDLAIRHLRIEVKTAQTVGVHGKGSQILSFDVRANRFSLGKYCYTKDYRRDCDFLMAIWLNDDAPKVWILPISDVPKTMRIGVSDYPQRSKKYLNYEGRFDLIESALEMRAAA